MPTRRYRWNNVLIAVGAFFMLISPTILSHAGTALFAVIGGVLLASGILMRLDERRKHPR